MIARLATPLFVKGAAAVGAALFGVVVLLFLMLKAEQRHADKLRENLTASQQAHAATIERYQAAARLAEQQQQANLERVAAAQETISHEAATAFRARRDDTLARVRAAASRDTGSAGGAAVPGLPAAPGGAADAPGDGVPAGLGMLALCEVQSRQLDELILWVERQASVHTSPVTP